MYECRFIYLLLFVINLCYVALFVSWRRHVTKKNLKFVSNQNNIDKGLKLSIIEHKGVTILLSC